MKKILYVIISILCINFSCLELQAQDNLTFYDERWREDRTYPIDSGDSEWSELSYIEQLEICNMPNDMLDGFSTEELADLVLEYPFLIDILSFDSAEQALKHFEDTSNICQEFFLREDSKDVLLTKYDELDVNYELLTAVQYNSSKDKMKDSGYIKELFLQTYFADKFTVLNAEEKNELKSIIQKKHTDKNDICDGYSTSLLIYDFVQSEYGYIPENIISETLIETELVEAIDTLSEDDEILSPLATTGFVSSGRTGTMSTGAAVYVGEYTLYGQTVGCYKYKSNDYTAEEIAAIDAATDNAHSSWTRVHSATQKYNCHSYAWIDASSLNVYWLNNPDKFASSTSFSYLNKNGGAGAGDRIIIRASTSGDDGFGNQTNSVHSLIVYKSGSDLNSILTTSKVGPRGVYDAPLVDMMIYYSGSYYDVYR